LQQAHGGGSDISIEDDIAEYTSVEMVIVDSFIEAMIRWQTVGQHCQHATCDSVTDLCHVSAATDKAQRHISSY